MAKKVLDKDQIAPKNIFENIEKGAESAEAKVKNLEKALKILTEAAKKVKGGITAAPKPKDVKSLKELNQKMAEANNLAKAKLRIDTELKKERIKLMELNKEQNKALKDEIILEEKQVGTLKKLQAENRKLRREREKLNLDTKEGKKRLQEINDQLDKNNARIEKSSDRMKKQRLGIGRYKTALNGLTGVLAKVGVAFSGFMLIRDSFNVIKDFDQAQANLASVLAVNRDEMEGLTEQAKELGATTKFTAAEVSQLQLEFAKLGFTQKEISEVTEATLSLAAAAGTELGRAAEVAGSTIRGFGLSTRETQRVVDVMAKSFSSSSLDMEKFATAMSSVAPIAKNMGFSIEETTALLGTLTDAGIDASTAGTGLRNIFLALTENGMSFEQAMQEINSSSDKTAKSLELFGKRGATLGTILAENGESIDELTGKLNNAAGAADEMAKKQLETLSGSLSLLRSAWEGVILKMNDAGGAGEKLRNGIGFLAENLEEIVKWLGRLGKILLIVIARQKTLQLLNSKFVRDLKRFGGSLKDVVKGAKSAGSAFRGMGSGLKAVAWTAAIAGAWELANAFWGAVSGARALQREAEKIEAATDIATQQANDNLDQLMKKREEQINQLRRDRQEGIIKTEKELLEAIDRVNKGTEQQLETYIDAVKKRQFEYLKSWTETREKLTDLGKGTKGFSANLASAELAEALNLSGILPERKKQILAAKKEEEDFQAKIHATEERLKFYEQALKDLGEESKDSASDVKAHGVQQEETGKKTKAANTEFSNQIDLLRDLNDVYGDLLGLLDEFQALNVAPKVADLNDELKDAVDLEKRWIEAVGTFNMRGIEKILNERKALEIQAARDRANFEIAELDRVRQLKFTQMREDLEKERQELLSQENLTAKDREKIEANFREEMANLDALQRAEEERDEQAKINIAKRTNNEIENIERETAGELKQINDELSADKKKKEEDEIAAALEKRKEQLEQEQEIIKALTDYFIEQADRRIAKIEEEIEAAQRQADFLAEAAAQGNITAKESLSEQNRLIAEANAEKQRLEERKQRILFVSSVLQAYNSNLAAGDDSSTAFTKAIAQSEVLSQALTSLIELPTFYEGTEDTGSHGRGLDGRGGFLSMLHPNERVLTKDQNKRIGDFTNEEVARVMEQHRLGEYVGGSQINVGWDNHLLVEQIMKVEDKLDQVNSTIINKPENSIEAGKIIGGTMQIIERAKKGHQITTRRFKVKAN